MANIQSARRTSLWPTIAQTPTGHNGTTAATCDLCGCQRFERISQLDRHGAALDTGVCVQCGLVAHLEMPSDAQLARFYAQEYRQQYHGESSPSARRLVRAWANGQRIYRQLAGCVRPGDRVFEVGAGIGCTVKVFEQAGCRSTGVEPHEGFREFSRLELHADVVDGDLSSLPSLPPQDLVLLVHVIEHLKSPTAALRCIHELLKPGGRLYVECPNLAAPFARRSQLFHLAHLHNFTPATLSMLAEKCGYIVERRYSTHDDPNLQMLLKRTDTAQLVVETESYRQTVDSLTRYNALTYHLRLGYLAPRVKKLLAYAGEHLFAYRRAQEILSSCAATSCSNTACSPVAIKSDRGGPTAAR